MARLEPWLGLAAGASGSASAPADWRITAVWSNFTAPPAAGLRTGGAGKSKREDSMALYMYQFAYTADSWAAQVKKPENRIENVGRAMCEAAGGKFIGGWLCFGEYDGVFVADVPNMGGDRPGHRRGRRRQD